MALDGLLRAVYLFKELAPAELTAVARICASEVLSPGDKIFAQGDQATALYIIQFGSIRIRHKTGSGEEIDVATLGTGSYLGEMAFVDGEKRSATAEAVERTEIVRIDYDKLQRLLDEQPVIGARLYKALAIVLSGRLRVTTSDLGFSRELNLRRSV